MRHPLRLLALVGVALALVLAAFVMHGSFEMPVRGAAPVADAVEPAPAGPASTGADSGEDVVARALRLAAIDSTKKTAWVDDIPDLDLGALSAPARATFLRIANGRRCGCGCGFTLAGCRRFDSECEVSGPRALALYDSVRAGRIADAGGFPERPAPR